ncbi:MAG: endolytic transglycosylase MltG [Bdellovibrionales bacterium]
MGRILALILALAVGWVGFEAFRFMSAGPGRADEEVVFEVRPGLTFQQIARDLEAKGLILNSYKMRVVARLTGLDSKVKKGEYKLNRAMTPQEILSVLISGKSIQYPVTFPEGSNVFEMAAQLEEHGFFKSGEFLKATRDPVVIRELLGIEVSSLEGYLFPETYNLTKYTTLRELLGRMVANFKSVYSQLENQNPERTKQLSRHEMVTLASVVEKETGAPSERPLIASVFFNRLEKKMRLQSDPTIIYGIWVNTGKYKKNITKDDITRSTPYNTYTVPTLPFGPIANPGREALAAVMKPATSEYLYFVSRNDGTHEFTVKYDDHMKAVKSFQLDRNAREGKSWRDLKKKGG